MWLAALFALLTVQAPDGFSPADPTRLPFVIGLPPGATIEVQGVSDYMTWRVRQGPEVILTVRAGIFAAPMLGMESQKGPVRQLRTCVNGEVQSRLVLLATNDDGGSLLVSTLSGHTDIADAILTSIRIPGKHRGVAREALFTCQSREPDGQA